MSRALAGLGGVVGAEVGGMAGVLIGEQIPPQPGFTPADDKSLVDGVGLVGAAIGTFVGAFLGAGSPQKAPAPGALSSPPRFP